MRRVSAPRELLIVSYWYPPAIGAAAERVHSFARHLAPLGWNVSVLTSWHATEAPKDARVVVHRALDPAAKSTTPFADYDPRARPSVIKSWLREFIFPDRFRLWQRTAVRMGEAVARDVDAILVSFPPASAVLAALALHEATRRPLIIDFRDNWFGPGGYELMRAAARARHEELERRALMHATGLIAVSDAMADALARRHKFPRHRIAVIPNGYDPDHALQPRDAAVSLHPLTISHVGTVIARNRPDMFFDSLRNMRATEKLADVRFRFVGNLSRDYIREIGLADDVESTGLVSRESARREMDSAAALLLLVGNYVGTWGNNAKLFEYVQTGRPILCLEETAGGNDAKLLRRFAAERSFFGLMHDPESIARAIGELRAYLSSSPSSALHLEAEFQQYSRQRLAAALSEAMTAFLKERK